MSDEHANPIADRFVTARPHPQRALDLFEGRWTSRFPASFGDLRAGETPLFEDPRVDWACSVLGGVEGMRVLELGPLEGGHSYMLEERGAQSITGVESNTSAFLRCLVVKEVVGLARARFLCGDFVEHLRHSEERYDLCFASGVLYHMKDPVELLQLIARSARSVYLWTHYFDAGLLQGNPLVSEKFGGRSTERRGGFECTLHRYEYGAAMDWAGFSGGTDRYSHWLTRDDILGCLDSVGMGHLEVGFDDPKHPNGPAFAVVATRG